MSRPRGPKNKHWKGCGLISATYFCNLRKDAKRRGIPCEITIEDLPVEIRQSGQQSGGLDGVTGFRLPPEGISFEELERSLIVQAMDQTGWNITRAARLLGLSFRTMQYRLDKFGIKRPANDSPLS